MSYAEIKHALNSTVGTDKFKPLDQLIESTQNLPKISLPPQANQMSIQNINQPLTGRELLEMSYTTKTLLEINKKGAWYATNFEVRLHVNSSIFNAVTSNFTGEMYLDIGYSVLRNSFTVIRYDESYGSINVKAPYYTGNYAFGTTPLTTHGSIVSYKLVLPYTIQVDKLKVYIRFNKITKASNYESYKNQGVATIQLSGIGYIS